MKICEHFNKRSGFLIMTFYEFSLHVLFRTNLQLAVRVFSKNEISDLYTTDEEVRFLKSFVIGYTLLQIPSARLNEIIGGKTLCGFGMFASSILSLLIPFVTDIGGLESLRIINIMLGLCLAPTNSAVFALAAKWIPLEERGKFISCLSSLSLGTVFMVISLQFRRYLPMNVIFVFPGILGIIWTVFWYFLVYDSPLVHPNITREERNYIVLLKESQGTIYKVIGCPWFEICFDPQVWVVAFTHTCNLIAFSYLLFGSSMFLNESIKINALDNPLVITAPFVFSFITAFLSGFLFDFLYRNDVQVTTIQKSFTLIGTITQALTFVIFVSFGHNDQIILIAYVVGYSFSSFSIGGYYTSVMDIAPNFAATLIAFFSTIGNIGVYFSTQWLERRNEGLEVEQRWDNVHTLISALLFTAATLYSLFGSSDTSDWNAPYEFVAV